ncbi:helix-turn-helix transcriptional regulator [Mesonia aestuariivivens]|uniref:Helix-turn-helix domain-containing protein n=1 Tax=Mesonia aestuariivivens TaxID=2796128 RepID=A0ABS6W6E6_9FLAO|nr:helix-turn-helix transcriptional regulator [Mesonia aestuariivivens]MBW2963122.1 helix-turn-helix domain-containing protein [Mesonia aestuariivivens]
MTRDQLKKKVGNRIIELRTKKGWNQSDLARECGQDRQAIKKLENGKVNPTIYSLYEIAKALKVDIYQLFGF